MNRLGATRRSRYAFDRARGRRPPSEGVPDESILGGSGMTLTLTDNAANEIRNIVAHPEVPDSSGVRITSAPTGGLTLSLAAEPTDGDTVVDEAGARVFLEPTAAEL